MSEAPSRRMFSATAIATAGSSHCQSVRVTRDKPTTTPAEVHTSVIRWRASPSSAMERCRRADCSIAHASAPLRTELSTESVRPQPSCSSGCGTSSRCTAAQMMPSAATMISRPSKPEEKYSALWCPYGWSVSAGRRAMVTINNANPALARFTKDSIASASRPTEAVIHQARVFSAIVSTATTMEARSKLSGFQYCGAIGLMQQLSGKPARTGHARMRPMPQPIAQTLRIAALAAACGLVALAAVPATAQVGPSTSEAAAYQGLHAAAQKGDLSQIQKLVEAKNDVNVRDGNGRTPLHVATFARQREAIRALTKAGADLNLLEHDRYDAVTIASVADDEETLRTLLALGASARQVTSRYDGTALIAAAHLGHDGVVRQLIAAGAPLDHVNNLHWTAVIESIVLGNGGPRHQSTLKALIDAGANLQLADRQGQTPLQLARARGYREMLGMLEKAGAR